MTLIISLLVIILSVTLAILHVSHRHKRMSSEIIRRLDDHNEQSQSNIQYLKARAEQVSEEAQNIREFFENIQKDTSTDDPDIADFMKTNKLK